MRLVLPLVLLLAAATACADASAEPDVLVTSLCEAIEAPDAAAAGQIFEARVHRPLHDVADEVAAVDRSVATRLLEAKFAVETVVRDQEDAPAPLVRARLTELAGRTREALEALDRPAPPC